MNTAALTIEDLIAYAEAHPYSEARVQTVGRWHTGVLSVQRHYDANGGGRVSAHIRDARRSPRSQYFTIGNHNLDCVQIKDGARYRPAAEVIGGTGEDEIVIDARGTR